MIITILFLLSAQLFVTEGFTKYYHIIDAFFLCCFFIDVISRFSKLEKNKIFFRNNLYASSILFFSLFLLSSYIWSPIKDGLSIDILLQGSLILNSIAIFYFVNKYNLLKYTLYAYMIYALINNLICLGILSNSYFSSEDLFNNSRLIGTSTGANNLAVDLLLSTFMTLIIIIHTKNIILKSACSLNILLTIYTILWTQSKKGLISISLLIIIFLYYYLISNQKNKLLNLLTIFGITSVIIVCLHDVINESLTPVVERLKGLYTLLTQGYGEGSEDDIRLALIKVGWNEFMNKPFMGHGQRVFAHNYYFYSHNNFIELLYNLGICGFVLYYLMFIRIFKKIKNSFFEERMLFAGICLIIILMDTATVSYGLRSHMLFLTLLSVMLKGGRHWFYKHGLISRKPSQAAVYATACPCGHQLE